MFATNEEKKNGERLMQKVVEKLRRAKEGKKKIKSSFITSNEGNVSKRQNS